MNYLLGLGSLEYPVSRHIIDTLSTNSSSTSMPSPLSFRHICHLVSVRAQPSPTRNCALVPGAPCLTQTDHGLGFTSSFPSSSTSL